LAAGLTVGVMLIPQGMAYAMLAGLPPIYGLYAATIPLIVYAFLGTSRQLSVGPGAMVAILIASGVGGIASQGTTEYIQLALLLALMIGSIQLLMGVLRMGFIVNFLSHPVIAGFTSAVAIIIAINQLKYLLGISLSRGMFHEVLIEAFTRFSETNWITFLIGISGISILILINRFVNKLPGPLIIVALSILIVWALGLINSGVEIVGDIPSGLPLISIPHIDQGSMVSLLPIAFTIAFIGFMQSIAVAKAIQKKHKNYTIVANNELIALGMANILGSMFKAFPVTGGLSRSAVNDQSGAKSGMASIISALLVIVVLLFFTPYFYYLPKAILAAIIMVAIYGLIDFKEARHLWRTDKTDFGLFIATALATLFMGIEEGIGTGVVLSLIMVVYRSSFPHIAELGQIPDSTQYRNVKRFDDLIDRNDTIILRIDARLYFANLNFIKETIYAKLANKKGARYLILDASAISGIDSSSVHMLRELQEDLKKRNISIHFVDVKGPIRDILKKNELLTEKGPFSYALTIDDAVKQIAEKGRLDFNVPYVFESQN
tara:strand:- start:378 stop:2021 length:1644 start_codon:yes stop_codon:yes gene_type:complete